MAPKRRLIAVQNESGGACKDLQDAGRGRHIEEQDSHSPGRERAIFGQGPNLGPGGDEGIGKSPSQGPGPD